MTETEIRKEKFKKIKNTQKPFKPNSNSKDIKEKYKDIKGEIYDDVSVAGRIISIRSFGGSAFFHILDGKGKIQCFIEKKFNEELMKFFSEFVDIGDIVGVRGGVFKTKKGEITIYVRDIQILTKSLRPLPEKWHGLRDIEERFRKRYLDMMNEKVREILIKRSETIKAIRDFMNSKGFIEVETPILHPIPGGALAKPFKTYHNFFETNFYLRIAPELYLKRLIIGGFEKIYEIGRNFRNEGVSSKHNPEFTMMEFYSAYENMYDFINLTQELISEIVKKVNGEKSLYLGEEKIPLEFKIISMKEEAKKILKIEDNDLKDKSKLSEALKRAGYNIEEETWEEMLLNFFEKEIYPKIFEPTFVIDFPTKVSPLAKRKDDDPDFVERFELIIGGMEIANAFSELTDPIDQRERFEEQLKIKMVVEELKEDAKIDEDFLCALEHGMPPTAGEGIGIDRLVMLITGAKTIKEVIPFPTVKPE